MATLTAGQSATVGLDAWATLTLVVSGSATIAFTSQAPNVHPSFNVTNATSRSYGPFGCPMSAVVTAVDRSVTYTVEGAVGGFEYDSAGNVTGLVGPDAQRMALSASYKTVLFGDSMTDTYETPASGLTGVYATSTGALTLTLTTHQQAVGWYVTVWNRTFTSALKQFRVPVLSVVDANTITVNIGAALSGVSASDTNWFCRPESWRSGQGFVPWLQAVSGQRFDIVYNGGQSGDTTQNALDRIDRDCLDHEPDVVIMQIPGINDTSSGNGLIKEDTIYANQCALVDAICNTRAVLILLSITPVSSASEARGTLTNMMRVIRLNQRLREYVKSKPNVIYFDAHKRIVDPASAVGFGLANYLRTADYIHYSMRGARFIATELWTQISSRFPSDFSTLPTSLIDSYTNSAVALTSVSRTSNVVTATSIAHGYQTGETAKVTGGSVSFNDYVEVTRVDANTLSFPLAGANGSITGTIYLGRSRNLYDYPTLATGTGGTVVAPGTGTAAAGVRVQNIAGAAAFACSVAARSDGIGNDQVVVITPGAANDVLQIGANFAQYSTQLPTVVYAGRSYVAEFELTMTGVNGSNLTEIRPTVTAIVGGTTYITYGLNGYNDGACLNGDVAAYHLRTAPMVLPSGSVTQMNWTLALRFSAAGTDLTVKVGRIALIETP